MGDFFFIRAASFFVSKNILLVIKVCKWTKMWNKNLQFFFHILGMFPIFYLFLLFYVFIMIFDDISKISSLISINALNIRHQVYRSVPSYHESHLHHNV